MKKYFFKHFIKIFIPFMIVFSVYMVTGYNSAVKNAESGYKDILKNYWYLISQLSIEKYITNRNAFHLNSDADIRITLLDTNGNVLFDTSIDNNRISNIENHLSRKEIEHAVKGEPYYQIRKSKTTGRYSIYYADKYKDEYILRIVSDGSIFHNIYSSAKSDFLIFFILFSTLIFIISQYIAYKISIPVAALLKTAQAVGRQGSSFIMPDIKDKVMKEAADIIYNINKRLMEEKHILEVERSILSNIINSIDEAVILFDCSNTIIKYNKQSIMYFGEHIVEGLNPVDNKDYNISTFFDKILEEHKVTTKHILYEKVFETTVKLLDNYKLLVAHDITLKSDYDDFKAELTANIAHEIKTPVAIIMAASETLSSDDSIPKDLENKFLHKINTSSKRLDNIINQTLALYKMENTGLFIEEKADIGKIITNLLIKESATVITYNNLTTKIYNIDSFHIEMILTNLINNAVKYSNGNEINVTIYDENNALIIEVADTGPQIPERERKRIFERFYTVSKSRSNSGFGLGLSIVKHTALLYSGKASVFPNNKNGNTFQIIMYEII